MTWTYETALAFLKRMGITPIDRTFSLGKQQDVGLGCWGALDYLKGEQGFEVRREKQ